MESDLTGAMVGKRDAKGCGSTLEVELVCIPPLSSTLYNRLPETPARLHRLRLLPATPDQA